MNENEDLSYCELRSKEVVNSSDGRRMGRIGDILFACETGVIRGVVVPVMRRNIFSKAQEIFIPWKCVIKIGEDVILVNVTIDDCGRLSCNDRPKPRPKPDNKRDDCCLCEPCCDPCCEPCCEPCNEDSRPDKCGGGKGSGGGKGCGDNKGGGKHQNNFPNCDRRCEKCMLFDCEYRWVSDDR